MNRKQLIKRIEELEKENRDLRNRLTRTNPVNPVKDSLGSFITSSAGLLWSGPSTASVDYRIWAEE